MVLLLSEKTYSRKSSMKSRCSGAVFIILLIAEFLGCKGHVYLKPEHHIVKIGASATYRCDSNITTSLMNWRFSRDPVGQDVYILYIAGEVKSEFQEKFRVSEHVEHVEGNLVRRTNLSVENAQMQDAGILFCSDKGGVGRPQAANLSVANGIDCSSACVNDQFLMTCYSCYWMGRQTSKDEHHPALNHFLQMSGSDDYIASNTSTESYDSNKNCNQMKSMWALNMSCKAFDKHYSIKPVVLLSSDLENVRKVNLTSEAIHVLVEKRISDVTTIVNGGMTETVDEEPDNTKWLKIAIGISSVIWIIFILLCARVVCLWRKTQKKYKLSLEALYAIQETSRNEAKGVRDPRFCSLPTHHVENDACSKGKEASEQPVCIRLISIP